MKVFARSILSADDGKVDVGEKVFSGVGRKKKEVKMVPFIDVVGVKTRLFTERRVNKVNSMHSRVWNCVFSPPTAKDNLSAVYYEGTEKLSLDL